MISFYVDIYDYATGEMISVFVGGYIYRTTSVSTYWYNCTAIINTKRQDKDFNVRFGHDGTNYYVAIGETTSVWAHPSIVVRDFQCSYRGNAEHYVDGWAISTETTTLSGVDETQSGNLPSANGTFAGDVATGNMTISGQEIDVSSGDLTLDVAGDIVLSADGGDIQLLDGATGMGRLGFENGDLNIASTQQDYDIRLKGNDGGSVITALHLDMSEGGNATFAGNITVTGSSFLDGLVTIDHNLNIQNSGVLKIAGTEVISATRAINATSATFAGNISTSGVVLFNDNQGINFGNSNAKIYGSSADGINLQMYFLQLICNL